MNREQRWFGVATFIAAVSLAGVSSARAGGKPREVSHIAVATFKAPDSARARSAILDILSEHDDVDVISIDDVVVAGKRIGADPTTVEGRQRLSEELGVELWLDGTIEDGSATFTLHASNGRVLATASLSGHRAHVAEGLAGPKVWEAMGPILSARERAKRAFETQEELAVKKEKARQQEMLRLRKVVQDRIAKRASDLKAARALAREKRAAFIEELQRQGELVAKRTAADERTRKEAERRQLAAEEAEFRASLAESSGPPPPAQGSVWGGGSGGGSAEPASSGTNVWGGTPAATAPSRASSGSTGTNVWGGAASAPTAAAPSRASGRSTGTNVWGGSAAGAASATAPSRASSGSAGTNVWGGSAATSAPAAPAASPWAASSDGGSTGSRTAPASDGSAPAKSDGLSPATRAWLAQQGGGSR